MMVFAWYGGCKSGHRLVFAAWSCARTDTSDRASVQVKLVRHRQTRHVYALKCSALPARTPPPQWE